MQAFLEGDGIDPSSYLLCQQKVAAGNSCSCNNSLDVLMLSLDSSRGFASLGGHQEGQHPACLGMAMSDYVHLR